MAVIKEVRSFANGVEEVWHDFSEAKYDELNEAARLLQFDRSIGQYYRIVEVQHVDDVALMSGGMVQ